MRGTKERKDGREGRSKSGGTSEVWSGGDGVSRRRQSLGND